MAGKSVLVLGAGGNIGAYATGLVAKIPEVDRVVLCDFDTYEFRNLINQGIAMKDVGKPKVFVQARRLAEMRPNLKVTSHHAPLESLPLGAWRADLIVACLDSRAARQIVNERAWHVGRPWIDSGVLGSECLARVNVYAPADDALCLECAWSCEDYRLIEQRYPCGGPVASLAPNTASAELGALAAAMLAVECRKMLAGETDCAAIGRQATMNARWHRLAVTSFRRNQRCRFDHATWRIEPLRCCLRELRIADLLEMAETIRVPGHRFVRRLFCPVCGGEKKLFRLEASLDVGQRECGRCAKPMAVTGFDIVGGLGRDLPADAKNQTLDRAGLRYGEVIEADGRYFEISANTVTKG